MVELQSLMLSDRIHGILYTPKRVDHGSLFGMAKDTQNRVSLAHFALAELIFGQVMSMSVASDCSTAWTVGADRYIVRWKLADLVSLCSGSFLLSG